MTSILVTMLLFQSLALSKEDLYLILADRATQDFRSRVETVDAPKTRALLLDLANRAAAAAGLQATPSIELTHRGVTPPKLAALPGGAIFVPVDQVRAAKNPSDLTGPIAHAVAHIAVAERRFAAQTGPPYVLSMLYPESGLCQAQGRFPRSAGPQQAEIEAAAQALTAEILSGLAAKPDLRPTQEELLTIAPPKPKPTLYRAGETAATSSPEPQR